MKYKYELIFIDRYGVDIHYSFKSNSIIDGEYVYGNIIPRLEGTIKNSLMLISFKKKKKILGLFYI